MSQTAIMNMALDLLEEEPMLTPDDNRPAVRWMNRNYQPVLDSMLRGHPWNFAIKRASLPVLSDAPGSGWSRAFQLPPDCLRVLQLTYKAALNGRSVPYAIEGRAILTDASAPLPVQYVYRVEDASLMDPMFVQALAASLGSRAANLITGKQSYAQLLGQMAKDLLANAQQVDAQEGTPPEAEAESWVDGRTIGTSSDWQDWR